VSEEERQKTEAQAFIGRFLTKDIVEDFRRQAMLTCTMQALALPGLLGIIAHDRTAPDDNEGATQIRLMARKGFPYQSIQNRDIRRLVWEGLEAADDPTQLRVIIIDFMTEEASSILIPMAPKA
jgi:hypothetical protein